MHEGRYERLLLLLILEYGGVACAVWCVHMLCVYGFITMRAMMLHVLLCASLLLLCDECVDAGRRTAVRGRCGERREVV